MNELADDKVQELLTILNWDKILMLAFGIAVLVMIVKVLKFISNSFQDSFPGKRIQIAQLQAISSYFIHIFGAIYLVVAVLQPSKEVILVALSSAAVAVGFALKDIVASLVAGLLLIVDRPFQMGDRVTHEDTYGDVVSIGLRSIRVRTLDDSIVTIPNSKFISERVTTGNDGAIDMMVDMKFYFPEGTDLNKVRNELYEVTATSKYVFLKKPLSITMSEIFLEREVMVRVSVKAYVIDTQFEKLLETEITQKVQSWKTAMAMAEKEKEREKAPEASPAS